MQSAFIRGYDFIRADRLSNERVDDEEPGIVRVIGAGFGRTGTMSMQAALEILGYRCYHMKEITEHAGHLQAWHDFVSGRSSMDWKALFQNFEATVDFPACVYYRELLAEFPEAKVILTVREPDRWFASFMTLQETTDQFRVFRFLPRAARFLNFVDLLLGKVFGDPRNRDNCMRVFDTHNQEVRKIIPADRLLVFRVQEGWGPLCQFLGRNVPEGVPFPHLNEGRETIAALARERLFGPWIRAAAALAAGGMIMVLIWWLLR